jgi:hypothetical protein
MAKGIESTNYGSFPEGGYITLTYLNRCRAFSGKIMGIAIGQVTLMLTIENKHKIPTFKIILVLLCLGRWSGDIFPFLLLSTAKILSSPRTR